MLGFSLGVTEPPCWLSWLFVTDFDWTGALFTAEAAAEVEELDSSDVSAADFVGGGRDEGFAMDITRILPKDPETKYPFCVMHGGNLKIIPFKSYN